MKSFLITGERSLKGTIFIAGAKNSALPLMAASILLKEGKLVLKNMPLLEDVLSMKGLLLSLGCNLDTYGGDSNLIFHINTSQISDYTAEHEIVKKFRASVLVLAPLLVRFGKAKISLPGGCSIGVRPIDLHIKVLKAMGVSINIRQGLVVANVQKRLSACDFTFPKVSVGATITAVLAAVCADGISNFFNSAIEPEIQDLCFCLNKMGAKISNIGSSNLQISGVKALSPVTHEVISDRIEAGTYMIAAAITAGEIILRNINPIFLENFVETLRKTGTNVYLEQNSIRVENLERKILPIDISTAPYPGFVTDLQAQFLSLMTLSSGISVVKENIFENRFMHVAELNRMGAQISLNSNFATVKGVTSLDGAEVIASDLRASASLVLAALAAKNSSKIHRIYHLRRGYQDLEKKLANCGAKIEEISD